MASVVTLKKGKRPIRRIDFVDRTDGGRRKSIRLGAVNLKKAGEAKSHIEKLLNAKILNMSIDQETAAWLAGISDDIHERIARTGLCDSRERPSAAPSLSEFCQKYLKQRKPELKPGSHVRLQQT